MATNDAELESRYMEDEEEDEEEDVEEDASVEDEGVIESEAVIIKHKDIWHAIISNKIYEILLIINSKYATAFTYKDINPIIKNVESRYELVTLDRQIPQKRRESYTRIKVDVDKQCLARCWDAKDINGKRCSRRKDSCSNLCKAHFLNAPHGLITDPLSPHLLANFKKYGKKSKD